MDIRNDKNETPQPDKWDHCLQQLLQSPLPEILPADRLRDGHSAISAKMGAKVARAANSFEEQEQLASLVNEFRKRIPTKHPHDFAAMAGGVLVHSRLIEELSDVKACSIIAEIRSRQGKCLLASANGLYEISSGPVFVWMRALPAGRQFIALYSPAALAEELERMTARGRNMCAREPRSLLFDYVADQASKIFGQHSSGKQKLERIERIPGEAHSFRVFGSKSSFQFSVLHHADTGNVSCRFHLPESI